MFQFHKGSIRTATRHSTLTTKHCFNSIKVQLELLVCALVKKQLLRFNSIKVQLERPRIAGVGFSFSVSIP